MLGPERKFRNAFSSPSATSAGELPGEPALVNRLGRQPNPLALVASAPQSQVKTSGRRAGAVYIKRIQDRVQLNSTTVRLLSGMLSGVTSRTLVAPLERIKLEYQIKRATSKSVRAHVVNIYQREGVRGFWRGNFVNLLRTAPYKAMNFYSFDTYRDILLQRSNRAELTNSQRAIAGAGAGITATVCFFPLDVIRTRIIANSKAHSVVSMFSMIVAKEGAGALYRGLFPALLSMAPNGAVFYGTYDWLKTTHMRQMRHRHTELSHLSDAELTEYMGVVPTLMHGALAGAAAETSTYPLDTIRRRLQLLVLPRGPLTSGMPVDEICHGARVAFTCYIPQPRGIHPLAPMVEAVELAQCSTAPLPAIE
ncbi:hypothetical protein CYMTET_30786 [Cymbomonas tetramitiformis]|uniref:Mitochondrial carrier protein n=1 Tax=Cymbomonas tetramitiformis TaxID=36881 RepID=A0AAE0FI88_9CHLO|nr:hypothetical protein CYMTET_30786 [Cymbomonas tetramitiformis]